MTNLAWTAAEFFQWSYGRNLSVNWLNDPRPYRACFGKTEGLNSVLLGAEENLNFNLHNLGEDWVLGTHNELKVFEDFLDLVIHEFGHVQGAKHYTKEFYEELSKVGGSIAMYLGIEGLPDWYQGGEEK